MCHGSALPARKFKAADGQEYRWSLFPDGEWQVSSDVRMILWVGSIADSWDGGMTVHEREDQLPRRDVQHEACWRAPIRRLLGLHADRGGGVPAPHRWYAFHLDFLLPFYPLIAAALTELLASLIIMRHIVKYNL